MSITQFIPDPALFEVDPQEPSVLQVGAQAETPIIPRNPILAERIEAFIRN